MRRLLLLSLLLLVSLTGCASLGLFGPRELSYSAPRIEQMLIQRFPHDWSGMGLLNLRLSAPRVEIPRGADRLRLTVDVAGALGNARPEPLGRLRIESGLRFDARQQAVFLDRPCLLDASLRGSGRLLGEDNAIWADPLLAELSKRLPIYRAEDSYSDGFGREWTLDDARIEDGKLRVRMVRPTQ